MTLRAGLIGLGEWAQLMHLPILAGDPRWRIEGGSDGSAELVGAMGARQEAARSRRSPAGWPTAVKASAAR